MRFGFAEACLEHDPGPRHPESADRLEAIRRALDRTHGSTFEAPGRADPDDIRRVHTDEHVAHIERVCETGGGSLDSDTVVSEESWVASLASAGGALWAAREARPESAQAEIPFALCRPPGHHALSDRAMGFCLFNNVAVAAEVALDDEDIDGVGILDWDVHHGNGTEEIFLDRPDVHFASIHEEGLYPGTGGIEETGAGSGEGATLNCPLFSGAGPATYVQTMDRIVVPWFVDHDPDLLLVSAGFDAHEHDPISRMRVTTESYGLLTRRVLDLADSIDARIGFVLEGGYGLGTLSESVVMVNDVCNGYKPVEAVDEPREKDRDRIDRIRDVHGLGS